jgi:hypothetical protein
LFLKRKPGLSQKEFREYYENHHAILGARVLTQFVEYRRNYPIQSDIAGLPTMEADFDVVTETWYEKAEDVAELLAHSARPDIRRILGEDEARFADLNSVRLILVEECVSDLTAVRRQT